MPPQRKRLPKPKKPQITHHSKHVIDCFDRAAQAYARIFTVPKDQATEIEMEYHLALYRLQVLIHNLEWNITLEPMEFTR